MKIVKKGSRPLTADEFSKIKRLAESDSLQVSKSQGLILDKRKTARQNYLKKILKFVDVKNLNSLKIGELGNGAAGPIIDELQKKLNNDGIETKFVFVHHEPDSSFPNGIPNPLLEENRFHFKSNYF